MSLDQVCLFLLSQLTHLHQCSKYRLRLRHSLVVRRVLRKHLFLLRKKSYTDFEHYITCTSRSIVFSNLWTHRNRPPALPAGWTEHWAPNNVPYYFNAATGVSTYIRPTLAASPPPPPGFGIVPPVAGPAPPLEQVAEPVQAKKEKKKKEKPVEKLPIEGTPWLRVTTNQGNVFFTNTVTKTSVWTVPEEIAEQVKQTLERKTRQQNGQAQTEAESSAAAAAAAAEAARLLKEKEAEMQRLREELEREREASRKRKIEEEEQEARAQQEAEESAKKKAKVASVEDDDEEDAQSQHNGLDGEDGADQAHEEEEELEEWQKEELKAKKELEKELEEPAPASQQTEFSSEEAIALFKVSTKHARHTALQLTVRLLCRSCFPKRT